MSAKIPSLNADRRRWLETITTARVRVGAVTDAGNERVLVVARRSDGKIGECGVYGSHARTYTPAGSSVPSAYTAVKEWIVPLTPELDRADRIARHRAELRGVDWSRESAEVVEAVMAALDKHRAT